MYTFAKFVEEVQLFVKVMWEGGHVDGTVVLDCSLESRDNDPFLPAEYQKQLKLTVRRPSDDMLFHFSVMYSVTEQLPELFFTCTKRVSPPAGVPAEQSENIFADSCPEEVDILDVDSVVYDSAFQDKTAEQKAFMITRKEHPLDQMIVFTVHECQIKKLMPAFAPAT